jgi:hypothetical protein
MSEPQVSVILPVLQPSAELADVAARHATALADGLGVPFEVIVVAAAGTQPPLPAHPAMRAVTAPGPGWGAAVRAGLAAARGQILCYTNGGVDPGELLTMLRISLASPAVVVRVNRKTRSNLARRVGSLAFNGLCRRLFRLSCWDVNGTPKIFARVHHPALLALRSTNDLIDLEFTIRCHREGYAVVEHPVHTNTVHNERPLGITGGTALFVGAWRMAQEHGGS